MEVKHNQFQRSISEVEEQKQERKAVDLFFDLTGIHPSANSLLGLGKIAEAFSQLPYENVSKVLKTTAGQTPDDWRRSPLEVIEDHAAYGLGGTCYSLTYFLQKVLTEIGVHSEPLLADMISGPNRHCALLVHHGNGSYLLDPGFLINEPVTLPDGDAIIQTPSGPLTLRHNRDTGRFHLFGMRNGKPNLRYELKPRPADKATFIQCWNDSFSWPNMNQLLITRQTDQGQIYLHNRHLRAIQGDRVAKSNLNVDLASQASNAFGIDATKIEQARNLLNQRRPKRKI